MTLCLNKTTSSNMQLFVGTILCWAERGHYSTLLNYFHKQMAIETHKTSKNPKSFVFLVSSLHTSQLRVNVCDIFIICRELANCLKSQFLWHFMAFITETWISHLPAPNVFTKLLQEKFCEKFVYEQMWVKALVFENLERDSIGIKIHNSLFIICEIPYSYLTSAFV